MLLLTLGASAYGEYWQTVDSFKPAIESPEPVDSVGVAAAPGGKVLITSHPGIINGKDVTGKIVRLNGDGSIDNSYNGPSGGQVLATYADGRILLVTQPVSGFSASVIQRFLADGSPDATFAAVAIDYDQFGGSLLTDGRLLVYGNGIRKVAGVDRRSIAIIGADGTLDTTFQSPFSADANIYSVAQTVDGQYFILSGQGLNLGTGRAYVARLNSNGTVDPTFAATDTTFTWNPSRTYPQGDSSVLVSTTGGDFFRLASTGLKDSTFSPSLIGTNCNFGPRQPDGKIYYTSIFAGTSTERQLHRINADGSNDGTFAVISTPYASSFQVGFPALAADGTLWLGPLKPERSAAHFAVSHVFADGSIDLFFGPRFARPGHVAAYARQADGKHLIAGWFDHVDNVSMPQQYNLVRLNEDGSLDATFSASAPSASLINGLAEQPGGGILVSGTFPDGNGGLPCVVRLTSTGASDASFHSVSTTDVGLNMSVMDTAGNIYGITHAYQIMRYNPDGTADATFQPAPFDAGYPVLVVPLDTGSVLVVFNIGVSDSSTIVRMLHDGSIDPAYTPPDTVGFRALSALPSGKALKVTRASDGLSGGHFVYERLNANGIVDYSYVGRPLSTYQESVFEAAGVLFDLVKEAASGGTAKGSLPLSANSPWDLFVQSDGQLIVHNPNGIPIQRYQRTVLTSPSVEASPVVVQFSPTSPALLRPLNYNQTFSVTTSGLTPFTYQWLKDGTPMTGKTSSSLRLRGLLASDAGNYSVQITNAYGTVTSSDFVLTIDTTHSSAAITTQPADQTILVGGTATFSVTAAGNPGPTYQWWFDDSPISGANGPTLTLSNVQLANAGTYIVQVSNTVSNAGGNFFNTLTSVAANLTVLASGTPAFTQQPANQTVSAGKPATLTVAATGLPAPTYQWKKNGVSLNGATNATYTIASASAADAGSYTVVATNNIGSVTSNAAILTVAPLDLRADFNGDGQADLLWQNTVTGQRSVWLMNGTTATGGVDLGTVPVEWVIAGTADFTGDGKTDLLWQNTVTGQRSLWAMNGTTAMYGVDLGTVSLDWWIAGIGDFNADGKPDILWTNTVTNERAIWLMNGTTKLSNVSLGVIPFEWTIAGAADFNLDGQADILWSNVLTGERSIWLMNGTIPISGISLGIFTPRLQISGTGDYNGDGYIDILLSDQVSGARSVWLMNGTSIASTVSLGTVSPDWILNRPVPRRVPVDFNADNKSDIVWQNMITGERSAWLMNGTTALSGISLGSRSTDWEIVATGDFNFDGRADLVWQNNVTGECNIWLMNGGTKLSEVALPTIPLEWKFRATGDFNLDGAVDLVLQNTTTGECAVWFMNGTTPTGGASLGIQPLTMQLVGCGDFNADSKADLVWTNTATGERSIWLMNGTTMASSVSLGVVPLQWAIAGTGDFDQDGNADLVWQNTATGERSIWLMSGTTPRTGVSLGTAPTSWSIRN